jgi:HEAT repeat protein
MPRNKIIDVGSSRFTVRGLAFEELVNLGSANAEGRESKDVVTEVLSQCLVDPKLKRDQITALDYKTLAALVSTLNSDPSPNVRLAAVEALYLFRNQPGVKESLVESLAAQSSPLVQVALIDLLVEIREQRASEALKTLIKNEKLDPDVKKLAEQGIKQLI